MEHALYCVFDLRKKKIRISNASFDTFGLYRRSIGREQSPYSAELAARPTELQEVCHCCTCCQYVLHIHLGLVLKTPTAVILKAHKLFSMLQVWVLNIATYGMYSVFCYSEIWIGNVCYQVLEEVHSQQTEEQPNACSNIQGPSSRTAAHENRGLPGLVLLHSHIHLFFFFFAYRSSQLLKTMTYIVLVFFN